LAQNPWPDLAEVSKKKYFAERNRYSCFSPVPFFGLGKKGKKVAHYHLPTRRRASSLTQSKGLFFARSSVIPFGLTANVHVVH
jgi:hypothetical protein